MADWYPLIINTGSSQIQELPSGQNLNLTGSNISNVATISINSTGGTSINNGGANATGNIGSAGSYFNRVFAQATTALYADLAEKYTADANYPPGTVVEFGGVNEATITTVSHSVQSAGIVSTNPSYLMNSGLVGQNVIEIAVVGRVPCRVVGSIRKGDRLVSSGLFPGVATALDMSQYQPGCIIGKALEDYQSTEVGTIEVAVGRL